MRFALLVAAALLLGACSRKPADPEAEVQAAIETVQKAAEASDLATLKDALADGFRAGDGRDKAELVSMLQLRFLQRRAIHTLVRIEEVTIGDDARTAHAEVLAALGAVPLGGFDALGDVRADLFQVELDFARDDGWQITRAKWKRASLLDL